MTRSIPFHKQTNASKLAGQTVNPLPETPEKQAGQVVFSPCDCSQRHYGDNMHTKSCALFDRMPFLKHSTAEPQQETISMQNPELYLGDYIARKDDNPKRITFDEWCNEMGYKHPSYGITVTKTIYLMMQTCWNAALKQGKL